MQPCSIVWFAGSSSRKGSDPNFSMIKNSIGYPEKPGVVDHKLVGSCWNGGNYYVLLLTSLDFLQICEMVWKKIALHLCFFMYSHMSYVSFISHILLAPFRTATYNHRHNYHHRMFKRLFFFCSSQNTHTHTRLSRGLWWEIGALFCFSYIYGPRGYLYRSVVVSTIFYSYIWHYVITWRNDPSIWLAHIFQCLTFWAQH